MQINNQNEARSVLATLRTLVPNRRLRLSESLRIAELQATRLLSLMGVEHGPIPDEVVAELPRIVVELQDLPTSGATYWNGDTWVIAINRHEPPTRQRFTLLHEYKHIIDHGRSSYLYTGSPRQSADRQAEQAADYFAGCALMPRTMLKRAWGHGTQDPRELARLFDVSERAVEVRLSQIGLVDDTRRCLPSPSRTWKSARGRYYRSLSGRWLLNLEQEQAA